MHVTTARLFDDKESPTQPVQVHHKCQQQPTTNSTTMSYSRNATATRNPAAAASRYAADAAGADVIEDFEVLLTQSRSADPRQRLAALREFCPCQVRKEVDQLWERVLEMTGDPDDQVRYQVLHTLCDGSPRAREEQVIDALRSMRNDKCDKVRRQVRRALVSYDKTGKWNIL
jgi:hypothetical protein